MQLRSDVHAHRHALALWHRFLLVCGRETCVCAAQIPEDLPEQARVLLESFWRTSSFLHGHKDRSYSRLVFLAILPVPCNFSALCICSSVKRARGLLVGLLKAAVKVFMVGQAVRLLEDPYGSQRGARVQDTRV